MAAPSIPQNVIAQQGNGQVYLSWDLSPGATTYPVLRSTDNVTFTQIAAPATNEYLDVAVSVGTQYYYQVQAFDGVDTSSASNAQGVVPTYAGQMSLGQIRLLAQQEADRENSNFVGKAEWNQYINDSLTELYDLLVTTYEDYFLALPYQFTTSNSANTYNLPDGSPTYLDSNGDTAKPFYKLMGVDWGLTSTNNARLTIKKFDFIARNRYVYPNMTSGVLGTLNPQYRLMGNKIHFIPSPAAGQVVSVWYIPRLAKLLKDSDLTDGINGWTEYVVVDAAIKALEKEESDVTALMVRKAALIKRIEDSAMNRDAGSPDTISATRMPNGWGWGPNGDGSFGGF